ncbi:MAG TPA: sigma-70 family RNA polymerase sigma factor [Chitinophaga sp.]|uniref:RNA polymerase sigma factor n=1 Tax=Chitinophaga sp. TaxID=1869181 RepID=UPI002DBE4807|nr:sigma-70 family RNA polymerase sigma factor [Chitinophaga sp.]HEU4551292.1 sigma-70 family RNA polymerase sigma factor [Chitinophaga sp.]
MESNAFSYQEHELIRRFTTGDEEAFTQIYDQFYFLIYQYARRWLPGKQDAEDITADTFVKLFQHREQFGNMEHIIGFLKVTCRNACINYLKHLQVRTDKQAVLLHRLSMQETPDFDWAETQEVFFKLVYAEVEKLPSKMKEIFLLSYRDGLKPAEIAQRLHLKVRTVSNQKANAIRILKAALAQSPLLLAWLLLLD